MLGKGQDKVSPVHVGYKPFDEEEDMSHQVLCCGDVGRCSLSFLKTRPNWTIVLTSMTAGLVPQHPES